MSGKTTFGVILISLGIIFILNYYEISFISNWWPMILVLFGAYQIIRSPRLPSSGLIIIVIGGIIQARKLELLPSEIVFPIILIAVGLIFIISRLRGKADIIQDDQLGHFIIFSGLETRSRSTNFKGGNVTAMFGGAEVDLREALLSPEGASLELSAAFGGIEIRVPEEWTVVATGLPLFGGYENKAKSRAVENDKPVLKVNCLALFGGVEIKN